MLQLTNCQLPWSRRRHRHYNEYPEADLAIYKLEKTPNFRWIAKHLGKRSDITLSSKDLVSDTLQSDISQIGQFAEVACGIYDPNLVWRYLGDLSKPGYPFELHDALQNATLLHVLHGRYSDVQALLAHWKKENQLVVAFSGTFNLSQTLHDLNAFQTRYSPCRKSRLGTVKVHAGFWRLYRGIRRMMLESLRNCVQSNHGELDFEGIVVTGHSLGCALALLFVLDLLNPEFCSKYLKGEKLVRPGWNISLILFGAPRVGNAAFAGLYRDSVTRFREEHEENVFHEYYVKAYNDGVPALPALAFGYRHVVTNVLYLHHGRLYHIPPSEFECSNFDVVHDEDGYGSSPPPFPLGGHNYYNGRDLEKTARRMKWIAKSEKKDLDEGWRERYLEEVEREKKRLLKLLRKDHTFRNKGKNEGAETA